MFRLEEGSSVDFLTQKDLKKPELHKVENVFKDTKDTKDTKETKETKETKYTFEKESEEKNSPKIETVFSNIKDKVDFNIIPENSDVGKIRMKIRFDYRGTARPARFFFGKKSIEEAAEELREQKMSLWQNIPLQGIEVEDIKVFEIYTIVEEDDDTEEEVAYAPIEIIVSADSLEDCVYLISREEFRRVEILEPSGISLSSKSLEKIFIKFSEQFRRFYEEYR